MVSNVTLKYRNIDKVVYKTSCTLVLQSKNKHIDSIRNMQSKHKRKTCFEIISVMHFVRLVFVCELIGTISVVIAEDFYCVNCKVLLANTDTFKCVHPFCILSIKNIELLCMYTVSITQDINYVYLAGFVVSFYMLNMKNPKLQILFCNDMI